MLTEDKGEFKQQNWIALIIPYFPDFELCWHSRMLCGANFVSENLNFQKNVRRCIYGNNWMSLMAHIPHRNVG